MLVSATGVITGPRESFGACSTFTNASRFKLKHHRHRYRSSYRDIHTRLKEGVYQANFTLFAFNRPW